MALLTVEQIVKIAPVVSPASLTPYGPFLDPILRRWNIVTPASIGAFVANAAEESAHFKRTLEYADGSEYEGRASLGNVIIGDGKKFKGRGLIQLTGRTVYRQFSRDYYGDERLLIHPELVEAAETALQSAAWFWSRYKNINQVCNEYPEDWTHPGGHQYTKIQWIRVLVNGGLNGIDEVSANYQRARKVLNF